MWISLPDYTGMKTDELLFYGNFKIMSGRKSMNTKMLIVRHCKSAFQAVGALIWYEISNIIPQDVYRTTGNIIPPRCIQNYW
jgi:hypothetical protein